jgi:hypothetical protein
MSQRLRAWDSPVSPNQKSWTDDCVPGTAQSAQIKKAGLTTACQGQPSRKSLPTNLIDLFYHPLALFLFYMDDGTFNYQSRTYLIACESIRMDYE